MQESSQFNGKIDSTDCNYHRKYTDPAPLTTHCEETHHYFCNFYFLKPLTTIPLMIVLRANQISNMIEHPGSRSFATPTQDENPQ
jgi:hypothetical protein